VCLAGKVNSSLFYEGPKNSVLSLLWYCLVVQKKISILKGTVKGVVKGIVKVIGIRLEKTPE